MWNQISGSQLRFTLPPVPERQPRWRSQLGEESRGIASDPEHQPRPEGIIRPKEAPFQQQYFRHFPIKSRSPERPETTYTTQFSQYTQGATPT